MKRFGKIKQFWITHPTGVSLVLEYFEYVFEKTLNMTRCQPSDDCFQKDPLPDFIGRPPGLQPELNLPKELFCRSGSGWVRSPLLNALFI